VGFLASVLKQRLLVPVEAEPLQAVEDRLYRLLGGSLPVRVLDPQEKLAARVAGIEPVKQGGAGTPTWRSPVGEGAKRRRMVMAKRGGAGDKKERESGLPEREPAAHEAEAPIVTPPTCGDQCGGADHPHRLVISRGDAEGEG